MSRRHHYRRRTTAESELDMTTFLNLMVVLVPFLLITAVFSRITIVELSLPSSSGGAVSTEPTFRIEVIVRDSGLELTDGASMLAKLPLREGAYDLEGLTDRVISLKRRHPDATDASVLLEPHIEYDHLIQVMDAVRATTIPGEAEGETATLALFSNVSIGDAP